MPDQTLPLDPPATIAALDTPAVAIDLDIVERNLRRAQAYADAHKIALRPHIKTHKIPEFAHRQIALGAHGITCQKLGEAEVMADAGISDILITYNLIGPAKMARLVALRRRVDIKVVADSAEVVQGLSAAMSAAGLTLPVMVECDTGAHRCGVVDPEDAARLGVLIAKSPGLHFLGLMTYPPHGGIAAANIWVGRALEACRREGLAVEMVSSGGTPDLAHAHELVGVTEHRPGTYIYNDRSLVERGACGWEDCALSIQATVVSHPSAERCIIDAGSKSLSSDTLGLNGYGRIVEYPALEITGLSEEHGHVTIPPGSKSPAIGERVSVIPDHACVVTNLHDRVYGTRGGWIERVFEISARGRTQ
jgi:D-serine deaminase-like pyridoxal phosphate-dependent protein